MKRLFLLAATLSMTGCASVPSVDDTANCDGTRERRQALAQALLIDGGPASKHAGATLIATLDAGCADP